jgi:hypothetical protein
MTDNKLRNLRVTQNYEFTKIKADANSAVAGGSAAYEKVRLMYECVLESDPLKFNDIGDGFQEVETLTLGLVLGAEVENLDVKTRLDLVAVAAAAELSGKRARYDIQIFAPNEAALGVVVEKSGDLSVDRLNQLTDAVAEVQKKLSEAKDSTGATRYRRVRKSRKIDGDLETSKAVMYAISRLAQADVLDKDTITAASRRGLSVEAVEATYLAYGLGYGDSIPTTVQETAKAWLAV